MGTELIKSIFHQQISNSTIRNVTKFKHRFSINFTKLEKKKKKKKFINPFTHIKILAYHMLIFQKKKKKQLSFKTKIIIFKIRPRATSIQPKEAKSPPKISLLLQTKPSKSISKIPSEFSTKQKKKKKKISFLRDFQIRKGIEFSSV